MRKQEIVFHCDRLFISAASLSSLGGWLMLYFTIFIPFFTEG